MTNDIVPATTVAEINRLHRAALRCAGEAVQCAKQAGDLLLEAKRKLGHGQWLPWLAEHCEVGERQAQRYMRLASNWDALAANTTATSDLGELGIDGALEKLATKKEARIRGVAQVDESSTADARYPEFISGQTAFCYIKVNGTLIYIISESEKHPGYWHIADMRHGTVTTRPMKPEAVRIVLGEDLRIVGSPFICRWEYAPMTNVFDGTTDHVPPGAGEIISGLGGLRAAWEAATPRARERFRTQVTAKLEEAMR